MAVRSEHETLLAAAVVVVGTRAVTKRCMAANGRAWAGEQELWMDCSIMSALSSARLRDACWKSSRNIELLTGERSLHGVFTGQRAAPLRVVHGSDNIMRWTVRNIYVP